MKVVTRFAPSPSGPLHIGGLRTVLFNWLFSKHHHGKFMLRIEDTDRTRSKDAYVQDILSALHWLGLDPEGEIIYQSRRLARYQEVLAELEKTDAVYRCYCDPASIRNQPDYKTKHASIKCPCRYAKPRNTDEPYALRLKVPRTGETVIDDLVQGQVKWQNSEINDLAMMRSDGTATYMFSVVVDDHDTMTTHVIRGDDHLTNSAKQVLIYQALNWEIPAFAHISLVHGTEGKKLSKREGAMSVNEYRELGYLPEALLSYITRLGWSHGEQEIISLQEAVTWFGFEQVSRASVKFSLEKLQSINAYYLRTMPEDKLIVMLGEHLRRQTKRELLAEEVSRVGKILPEAKLRAKTLVTLADMVAFVLDQELPLTDGDRKLLATTGRIYLEKVLPALESLDTWQTKPLYERLRNLATGESWSFGKLATVLRVALTGRRVSPGISDVLFCLGKEQSLQRLRKQLID